MENTVKELSGLVLGTIKISKVKDPSYINTYEKQLIPLMKSLGDSNNGLEGLYINFYPKFTDGSNPLLETPGKILFYDNTLVLLKKLVLC